MIAKNYDEIDWAYSQKKLAVLQHDILEAYKKKDSHRILITQNKLIRSFAARSLAVRKGTSNRGKKVVVLHHIFWVGGFIEDQWWRRRRGDGRRRRHAERDNIAALIRNRDRVRREPAHECRLRGVAGRVRRVQLREQEELGLHQLWLLRVSLTALLQPAAQVPEPHHT